MKEGVVAPHQILEKSPHWALKIRSKPETADLESEVSGFCVYKNMCECVFLSVFFTNFVEINF